MDRRKFLVGSGSAGLGAASLVLTGTANADCPAGTDAQMAVFQTQKAVPANIHEYPASAADGSYTIVNADISPGKLGRYQTVQIHVPI